MTPEEQHRIAASTAISEPARRLLQYFAYDHLPVHLRPTSQRFHDLAWRLAELVPHNAEHTVGLRKLLEAKDCYVRAMLPGSRAE